MDMKASDLSLMRALDVLLDEMNVTKAASRLAISQPALSAQLTKLRTLFGDPLLVPASTGRGMVATPRALAVKGALRAALQQLDEIVEKTSAFDPAQSRRVFRIVANDNAAMMIGAALVARIQAMGVANIRIAFLHPTSAPFRERLEQGEADVALGGDSSASEGLIRRPLLSDRFKVAQRLEHPRGREPFDLDDYCRFDHVLVSSEGGGFASTIDRLLETFGRRRNVAVSVQTYTLAPSMLVGSDLLCTLPSRFLSLYADRLDIFELPLEMPRFALSAFWHPRMQEDPPHAWLREQLVAVSQ
jgi:DNA-binding transcriptional LysR family regulator